MKPAQRPLWGAILLLGTLLASPRSAFPGPWNGPARAPEEPRTIEGRILCLDATLAAQLSGQECNDPQTARFALRAASGQLHYFLPHDPIAEMFTDPRVRARDLHIVGWPRDEDHFEIMSVYSVKEGKLHHIHYRCDVCDITATAPGPCWCCRQEFELREQPVEEQPVEEGASGNR